MIHGPYRTPFYGPYQKHIDAPRAYVLLSYHHYRTGARRLVVWPLMFWFARGRVWVKLWHRDLR